MYSQGIDIASIIQRADKYVVANDRRAYLPALRIVENFAVSRGMIIGGRAGLHALCGLPIDAAATDLWMLELFSSDIEQDMEDCARCLTHQLRDAPKDSYHGDYRSVVMQPKLPGREYAILADFRLIAIGYTLGERKGINITDIITPIRATGPYGTSGALLLPRDMQIMRVAQQLYNPMFAANWPALITQFGYLASYADLNISGKAHARDKSERENESARGENKFALENGILIGERAVDYYTREEHHRKLTREQLLCSFDGIEEFAEDEHMVARYMDIRVPVDFRLRKITLRDSAGNVVADIYNSPAYEPIPVNTLNEANGKTPLQKRFVAAPFVVLRFLFVEIWALEYVIAQTDASSPDQKSSRNQPLSLRQNVLRKAAQRLIKWILHLAADEPANADGKMPRAPMEYLFPTEYIGVSVLENVAKRQQLKRMPYQGPFSAVDKKDLIAFGAELIKKMHVI